MVVGSLLAWAKDQLEGASARPGHEARMILKDIMGLDEADLIIGKDREVPVQDQEAFEDIVLKRKDQVPLAYILGKKNFMGLDFYVCPEVLIPRPETELSVQALMDLASDGARVLELGVGSGCVSISLALLSGLSLEVLGADISPGALEVAKKNRRALGAGGVDLVLSDLFSNVFGTYDIIYSNPPYVACDDYDKLEPSVKDHEPALALKGGREGLDFYKKISRQAPAYLRPGGHLVFEIGQGQAGPVQEILQAQDFKVEKIIYDYSQIARVIIGTKEE